MFINDETQGYNGEHFMKICHVVRRFCPKNWGGIEEAVINLAKAQIALGHNVEIVSTKALNKLSIESIEGVTVKRFSYFYPYFWLPKFAKQALDRKGGSPISLSMILYLFRCKYDVIHCHSQGRLNSYFSRLSNLFGSIYFLTLHGGLNCISKNEEQSLFQPGILNLPFGRFCDLFFSVLKAAQINYICVSKTEKENLHSKHSSYIPNGVSDRFDKSVFIDFKEELNLGDKKIILNVSRIDKQKNQLFLLNSLKDLNCKKYHLILCGPVTDPMYYRSLKDFIKQNNLDDQVTFYFKFKARSKELYSLYRSSDFFVLPSIHEPFGIVLLEAWMFGLKVIANPTGGVFDLLQVFDGAKLDINDSSSLSKAMSLVENSNLDSSRNLSILNTKFSWTYIAETHVSLYKLRIKEKHNESFI